MHTLINFTIDKLLLANTSDADFNGLLVDKNFIKHWPYKVRGCPFVQGKRNSSPITEHARDVYMYWHKAYFPRTMTSKLRF